MTDTLSTTTPVTTGLYIGGAERSTDDVLEVVDPARPGVVVGSAAAASKDDVADAVAAAKAAYPAWSALSATERAARIPVASPSTNSVDPPPMSTMHATRSYSG